MQAGTIAEVEAGDRVHRLAAAVLDVDQVMGGEGAQLRCHLLLGLLVIHPVIVLQVMGQQV